MLLACHTPYKFAQLPHVKDLAEGRRHALRTSEDRKGCIQTIHPPMPQHHHTHQQHCPNQTVIHSVPQIPACTTITQHSCMTFTLEQCCTYRASASPRRIRHGSRHAGPAAPPPHLSGTSATGAHSSGGPSSGVRHSASEVATKLSLSSAGAPSSASDSSSCAA